MSTNDNDAWMEAHRIRAEVEPTKDYTVLWGDDDKEHTLHVKLTGEGVIIDLFDGVTLVNTWGRTAQEMADLFWGEGEDATSPWAVAQDMIDSFRLAIETEEEPLQTVIDYATNRYGED